MNAQAIMQELTMNDHEIQRRLNIVGFDGSDLKRVLALSDIVVRNADEMTASFFAYLLSLKEAAELAANPIAMDTARRLKREHLKAMVGGEYGLGYVEERLLLGMLYAEAGLDPRVFLGAYHHLIQAIGTRVLEHYRESPIDGFNHFVSLEKIAFFDLSLIIDTIVFERERVIRDQQEAIRQLSTPVLRVRDQLLILPIIGAIDTRRATQLTDALLKAIRTHRAKVVVMDITGVPTVDAVVANHLARTVLTTRLIGATTIITGLSSPVAEALVAVGVDAGPLVTAGDLEQGIEEAERILGARVAASGMRA